MHMKKPRWRRAAVLLFGSLALAACDEAFVGPRQTPMGDEADVALEISSASARAGDRVAVGIRADAFGTRPIGSLQGRINYDANRLRYVGQAVDEAFVLLDDAVDDRKTYRFYLKRSPDHPDAYLLFDSRRR